MKNNYLTIPRLSLGLLRFSILERYVAREFVFFFLLTLLTMAAIYLIVDFFEKIDRLLRAQLNLSVMLSYFSFKMPLALGQVMPAAVLLAVMITFALLSRHNETIAIKTAGINVVGLLKPLLMLAGLFSGILLALNLYLIPWSTQRVNEIWETQVEKKPSRSLMNLERFWYKGDRTIFNILMFHKDTQALEGVKIYFFDQQFRITQIVAAARAQWTGKDWRFYQGLIQSFQPDGMLKGEVFQEQTIALTERPEDFSNLERKITEMDFSDLYLYAHRLERDGYDPTQYRVDLLGRISLSLTPLIVTLIGGGLILQREKSNIPAGIATGIGIVFVYWLILSFFLSMGQVGRLPAYAAAWLPNILFGLGGLFLLSRVSR